MRFWRSSSWKRALPGGHRLGAVGGTTSPRSAAETSGGDGKRTSDAGFLRIDAVSKVFEPDSGRERVVAVRAVSFAVRARELVCILGRSGCGKTTLLRIMSGLEGPTSGAVYLEGARITRPGPEIGMVFQDPTLFPWRTVEANIALGLESMALSKEERSKIVRRYVILMGLEGFERRYPHELSGGIRQRVALARAFAPGPRVVLMDEPFGALDAQSRFEMQRELLRVWRQEMKTIVFVTHSVGEALYLADRVVFLPPRPGPITDILDLNAFGLNRPRDMASERFNLARRRALSLLGYRFEAGATDAGDDAPSAPDEKHVPD
jgi:NitT/TauT family transport system ATP-binding protein